jgi:hypothetical protein
MIAAAYGSITTVAWVVSARAVVALGALLFKTAQRTGVELSDLWRTLRPIAGACAAAWDVAYPVSEALDPSHNPLVALLGSTAAGGLAYLCSVRVLEPGLLPTAVTQIRRTLSREPIPVS